VIELVFINHDKTLAVKIVLDNTDYNLEMGK